MDSVTFGWLDYVIFLLAIGLPVCIGIYFGCVKKKQNTTDEYLYGSGKMTVGPIGLSLYSSSTSAVLILGIPAEVYVFGGQIFLMPVAFFLSFCIVSVCILPVFCGPLKLSSPYEYIELRFNGTVRVLMTVVYVLHTLTFMPIVLFACTVTFSEATGVPLVTCILTIGGLCVFYTTVGGFPSVIWADSVQGVLMFATCVFILGRGVLQAGGVAEVWHRARDGHRLDVLNMDPDPFVRLSTFSVILGRCVWQTGHIGAQASTLQRFMALPSEQSARRASLISTAITSLAVFMSCCTGLCMYAYYATCDPVTNAEIGAYSKITSYFIARLIRNVPGLLGFFTAGLLSAGLSTISSEMNTVGGLIYHDIVERVYKRPLSPARSLLIMKAIVCLNGVLYLAVAPFARSLKHLLQMASTISGVTFGVKAGVMLLGTTFPKCNVKGVICGMTAGLAIVSWISIGSMQYDVNGEYALPTSIANCSYASNSASLTNITASATVRPAVAVQPMILYKLSFQYYSVLGCATTLAVAMLVSYLTGFNDVHNMDPRLIIPLVRPAKKRNNGELVTQAK